MSKSLISRLSIILFSSLMVIQSCQTPTNTINISESKKFSIKANGCEIKLPFYSDIWINAPTYTYTKDGIPKTVDASGYLKFFLDKNESGNILLKLIYDSPDGPNSQFFEMKSILPIDTIRDGESIPIVGTGNYMYVANKCVFNNMTGNLSTENSKFKIVYSGQSSLCTEPPEGGYDFLRNATITITNANGVTNNSFSCNLAPTPTPTPYTTATPTIFPTITPTPIITPTPTPTPSSNDCYSQTQNFSTKSVYQEIEDLENQIDELYFDLEYIDVISLQFNNLITDLDAFTNRPDSDIDTNLQGLINESNNLIEDTNLFIHNLIEESEFNEFSIKGNFDPNKLPPAGSLRIKLRGERELNPYRMDVYKSLTNLQKAQIRQQNTLSNYQKALERNASKQELNKLRQEIINAKSDLKKEIQKNKDSESKTKNNTQNNIQNSIDKNQQQIYNKLCKKNNQLKTYTYANGTYEASPKHGTKDTSYASRAPKDGQEALDNSLKISDNSTGRIGVSQGEIVLLRETTQGVYHGYVSPYNKLTEAQKNVLLKSGLVNQKGKILDK